MNHFSRRQLLQCVVCVVLSLLLAVRFADPSAAQPRAEKGTAPATPQAIIAATKQIDPECERYGRCLVNAKTVFAALDVERLTSSLDLPNNYTISGWFSLNWLPAAYPGWQPSNLALGCRSSGCRFSGWRDSFTEEIGGRRFWTARFELEAQEADSFFAYPFDQHWVKILIQSTTPSAGEIIHHIDLNSFSVELAPSLMQGRNSNFRVNYATVGQQADSFLLNAANKAIAAGLDSQQKSHIESSPDVNIETTRKDRKPVESDLIFPISNDEYISTSISFHLVRRTPAALLMIITPMLLILFNTIMAFHWRENSPASRFGSSGLLTTVSLFFASRVFRPDVDELVFSDVWFIVVFIVITINNVILVWLFRFYKHRSGLKQEGTAIPPTWKTENRLSLISGSTVIGVIIALFLISLTMLRPPAIPIEFLAGNSNHDDVGVSVVKVIERHELLPSNYLITMPPGSQQHQ
jgi:hypothetical protein